jgi:hypothetical protein
MIRAAVLVGILVVAASAALPALDIPVQVPVQVPPNGAPPAFFGGGLAAEDGDDENGNRAFPPAVMNTHDLLALSGESSPAEAVALPEGMSGAVDPAIDPGREKPATAAAPVAFTVSWGNQQKCHSLVVVGKPVGLLRPAYVVTFMDDTGRMAVAYQALAFRDAKGVLHIDARHAIVDGPQARQWSPDSMAIFATGEVHTRDDSNPAEVGVVTSVACPNQAAQAGRYRHMLDLALAMVDDSL